jgi:hypothetical protein
MSNIITIIAYHTHLCRVSVLRVRFASTIASCQGCTGCCLQVPAPDAVFDYVMGDVLTAIVVELVATPPQV